MRQVADGAARAAEFDHMDRFYNPRWRHSKRGHLGPMEFEDRAMLVFAT